MVGIKVKISPLFFIGAIYYLTVGKFFEFLIFTLTAVIHELGHSYRANILGYSLNKITLLPFGAVVSGESDLRAQDEIKIALFGPFINICAVVIFLATWWIYPTVYAFTDVAMFANLSMAVVNLLPAYPLDGGRVLCALLADKRGRKQAEKICKIISCIIAVILIIAFILTAVFGTVNFSLLLFSGFVFFSLFENGGKYEKTVKEISKNQLMRGVLYKKQAVDISVTLKRLISVLDFECVNEIVVFSEGKPIAVLSQEKINQMILTGDLYSPIGKLL